MIAVRLAALSLACLRNIGWVGEHGTGRSGKGQKWAQREHHPNTHHTQTGKERNVDPPNHRACILSGSTSDFRSLTSDQKNVTEYGGAEVHSVHDLNHNKRDREMGEEKGEKLEPEHGHTLLNSAHDAHSSPTYSSTTTLPPTTALYLSPTTHPYPYTPYIPSTHPSTLHTNLSVFTYPIHIHPYPYPYPYSYP